MEPYAIICLGLIFLQKLAQADRNGNFLRDLNFEGGRKEDDNSTSKILLPQGYNKLAIPTSSNGTHVYVVVSLFIRTILEVDQDNEELIMDADFGMRWIDWKIVENLDKLNWTDPVTKTKLGNRTLDSEVLRHIWKPDVYVDEMASADRTSILSSLDTLHFLGDTGETNRGGTGYSDKGDIVYSERMTLKLRCDMSFEYYPADIQTCEYYIRSYSYPVNRLKLYWREGQGIYLDDPSDPNFDLMLESAEPRIKFKELLIEEKFDVYRQGNYSSLKFTIKVRRKLNYHIVQTYLPSVLLIFITWLCFLIPSNMVEARIGISMTTVLTLTAMFAAVREQSPSVSYSMAIDVWMVFNIFFVFIALFLFTLIYWMKRRLKKRQKSAAQKAELENGNENDVDENETYKYIVEFTKRYAFPAFSVVFVAFFLIYWLWLMRSSDYLNWTLDMSYNADADVSETGNDSSNLYLYHETLIQNNDTTE